MSNEKPKGQIHIEVFENSISVEFSGKFSIIALAHTGIHFNTVLKERIDKIIKEHGVQIEKD